MNTPTLLPRPIIGAPPAPQVPVPHRWEMANGLRVVAVPRRNLPQVVMRLIVPAGATYDPPGRPGTAAMTASLLTEGTATRSAEQINLQLDLLGASLGAEAGQDFAEVDLVALSETFAAALELFAEVVSAPTFPARELERARAETLDALDARDDEPANVADDLAAAAIFGADHPYGRLTMGTADGVRAITVGDLLAFHAARYTPAGSVLVIAGDFDPDTLASELERTLGAWRGPRTNADARSITLRPTHAGEAIRVEREGAAQGEIRFAGLGMSRADPRWVEGAVANYIIGGSTITGRLGANLREDKGWTYGARSGFAAALHGGGWVIDTAVDLDVVDLAIAEIAQELRRFSDEPVGDDELERAKQALTLSLPRAFETSGRIVGRLATIEAYGLPHHYWERFPGRVASVTTGDVLRIANEFFSLDRLVRIAVGVPE